MRTLLAMTILLAAAQLPAAAQVRAIPEDALLGRLSMGVFPDALLDGKAVRLGPGARIYDESNIIVMPGGISGEKRVAYLRGTMGEVVQVWILTPAEQKAVSERIAEARRRGAAGQR
jgi:hypothetical protein